MEKKLKVLWIVAALAITICTVFTGCVRQKSCNLNDHVVMEFKCVDGYAELTDTKLDYEQMNAVFVHEDLVYGAETNN